VRTSRALAFALIAVGCSSPSSPGGSRSVEPSSATSATSTSVVIDDKLPELPADAREAQLAKNIERLLSKEHVRGQVVGDAVSKDAFPKYLEELDGGKLFLLASDVRSLSAYTEQMDDELREGDLTLAHKGGAVLKQRRVAVAKIVADLLAKPFDFTVDEKIESDPKKVPWAASEAELTDRWRKFLKMQALERITQLEETAEAQAKKTPKKDEPAPVKPLVIPPTFEGKEEKARTELAASYAGRFTRMADMESLEPAEKFINAVASVYDPHTLYMPPAEKENFDIQISGSLEGIGAALGEEDHYIVVRDLIPGGASWSQGKLEVGDLILAVAQQGKDPIDVTDVPIDKVVTMVRGPKGTLVTLTVKKADGHTENIAITRDVVRIEASYARGATLDRGPKSDTVGYVYLPGFYGDTRAGATGPGERNATGDVRKLLEKFQKQKLGTVIIDLRGNGGGLLGHARDITGLLIDTGPVVQTKSSDGEIGVLEDTDKGVAFTGDVVVMVDRFSASASEILAGALQDYQRAVIVGTGPTHGKGTVQTLVDLDRMRGNAPTKESMGVFKLTIEQYYRVNGDSTQWRGVVPDITPSRGARSSR
jgi:carboxyl-terminal processing protease